MKTVLDWTVTWGSCLWMVPFTAVLFLWPYSKICFKLNLRILFLLKHTLTVDVQCSFQGLGLSRSTSRFFLSVWAKVCFWAHVGPKPYPGKCQPKLETQFTRMRNRIGPVHFLQLHSASQSHSSLCRNLLSTFLGDWNTYPVWDRWTVVKTMCIASV